MKNLLAIPLLLTLPKTSLADTNSAFMLPSGVKVEIIESVFMKDSYQISGCSMHESTCIINNNIPFGIGFGLPKTYVKSITTSYQGRSYALDTSNMYNAWGNRPLEYKGVIRYFGGPCSDAKNCQFRGLFSDASGSFVAEWKVVNGLPIRTILTSSNDVMNLFSEHIDPPEFE